MKVFNPEKELYKIQHGNRNKVILFVISLLLVGIIGYSFALYQVRYSKRIIYTKVAPFSSKDIELAVNIIKDDGAIETRKTFPNEEEGLSYIGLECEEENITSGSWDRETWSLNLNTKGPNKCTVLFEKGKSFSEIIVKDDETIFNDDPGGNLRYAGASDKVNNYIWFNCDDYNNLTQETAGQKCEKWRIIGLFNNITKTAGGQENLVKIIRATSVGIFLWDTSETYGSNNWTKPAEMQTRLKNYYNGTQLNDNYGNSAKGITNTTQGMIEQVTWNIGGTQNVANSTAAQFYTAERGRTTYNNQPSTWPGYVGLMYPSDYGYATGGSGLSDDSITNRTGCLNTAVYNWGSDKYRTNCAGNSWLFTGTNQWTITSISLRSMDVARVSYLGATERVNANGQAEMNYVRPSLYLKSSVKVKSEKGNESSGEYGSITNPYILIP